VEKGEGNLDQLAGLARLAGCSTLPTTVQNSMHTIRAITITTATTIAINITITITNSTTPDAHTYIHKILQRKLSNNGHRNCKEKITQSYIA
jgi:hypothetical protein